MRIELLKQARDHLAFAQLCGDKSLSLRKIIDDIDNYLKKRDDNWIIKKVPNTRDQYYVESGRPPKEVLDVYGIKE